MDFEWAKERHYEGYDLYRVNVVSTPRWIWRSGSEVLVWAEKGTGETAKFTIADIDAKDWKIVEPEFDISKRVMTVKDPKPHVEGTIDVIEVSGFKEYMGLVRKKLDERGDDASAMLDLYGGDRL